MDDELRSELEALAEEQSSLPARRAALVEKARRAGVTWSELAGILGMTSHGLIKAARAHNYLE